MIALVRYVLADYGATQRYLPPVLAYLAGLAVLHAVTGGPILPAYAASAVLLAAIVTWLTIGLVNSEEPTRRLITVSACGGHLRLQAARSAAALVFVLGLAVVALGWPMAAQRTGYSVAEVALGAGAHLACGLVGVAIGTVCARPVITRLGYGVAFAVALLILATVIRDGSPVNGLARLLNGVSAGVSAGEWTAAGLWVALSVVLAAAATVASGLLGPGRP